MTPLTNDDNLPEIIAYCQAEGITRIIPTRDGELAFWSRHGIALAADGSRYIAGQFEGTLTLGPVTLRNRTVKAATFEGRAPHGQVTDALIDYHLAVARGGIGLTTVAYLAVAPEGRTHREQVVVGPDTAAGLRRLTEDEGAAVTAGAQVAALALIVGLILLVMRKLR